MHNEQSKFVEEIKVEEKEKDDMDPVDSIDSSDEDEMDKIHLTPQNPTIDPLASIKEGDLVTEYIKSYSGHRNVRTVKEVNFYGPKGEYVISGSDCGHVFFWNKNTAKIVNIVKGDKRIVNCLSPHPLLYPILATSGIENDIKIWEPFGESKSSSLIDIKDEIVEKNLNPPQNEFMVSQNELLNLMILLSRNRNNAQELFELFHSDDEEIEEEEE